MVEYSDHEFEMRLANLSDSHSKIHSLCEWCIKHQEHHLKIINIWMTVFKKINVERRLNLFYLANDVIQISKNIKCYKFVDGFAPVIKEAMSYVKDERIQSKISRVIKIWKERVIYDYSYLDNLTALLTSPIEKIKYTDPVQQFQADKLIDKIHCYVKSKQITDVSMKKLRGVHLPLNSDESIEDILKDSSRSHQILNELIRGKEKIDDCIKALLCESSLRARLFYTLEIAKSYFDKKNEDIKIVPEADFPYTDRLKLEKSNKESSLDSMSTDSPMSFFGICSPSFSASSMSVENLKLQYMSYENTSKTEKYMINSMENNNNINTLEPNSVINNQNHINHRTTSIITSDSYNTVQTWNETMNNSSTNGSPALPFCHEKMPDQDISLISKTESHRKQHSNDLNLVHNQFPCNEPQQDSTKKDQLKGNFRPKWKKSIINCTRSPRNFNQYYRSNSRWD